MQTRAPLMALLFVLTACPSSEPAKASPTPAREEIATDAAKQDLAPPTVQAKRLNRILKGNGKWNRKGVRKMGPEGIEIVYAKVRKAETVQIQRSNAARYQVHFFNGDTKIGTVPLYALNRVPRNRLGTSNIKTPDRARSEGFDRIQIVPFVEKRYSIGGVRLDPPPKAAPGGSGLPGMLPAPGMADVAPAKKGDAPAAKPAPTKPAPTKKAPAE